jgi:hypothetical protein
MINPCRSYIIPREGPPYPSQRGLGEPQGQSGWVERTQNLLASPGFKPRLIQPLASCYTDYAILAPKDLTGEKAMSDPACYITTNCDTYNDNVVLVKSEDARH